MTNDMPQDVLAQAEDAYQQAIFMTTEDEPRNMVLMVARAILAERERIARWHETQAEMIEAALDKIAAEGGTVEVTRRSLAALHRDFAAAIRRGDGS